MENRIRGPTLQGRGLAAEVGEGRHVCVCVRGCVFVCAVQVNQGRKSAGVSRCDENKGGGSGVGGGRRRVAVVTVTEFDTRLQPRLMACPLISAANVSRRRRRRHRAAAAADPSPVTQRGP